MVFHCLLSGNLGNIRQRHSVGGDGEMFLGVVVAACQVCGRLTDGHVLPGQLRRPVRNYFYDLDRDLREIRRRDETAEVKDYILSDIGEKDIFRCFGVLFDVQHSSLRSYKSVEPSKEQYNALSFFEIRIELRLQSGVLCIPPVDLCVHIAMVTYGRVQFLAFALGTEDKASAL